ncbi:9900_t:CDS:2, partial [Racocetra persica]
VSGYKFIGYIPGTEANVDDVKMRGLILAASKKNSEFKSTSTINSSYTQVILKQELPTHTMAQVEYATPWLAALKKRRNYEFANEPDEAEEANEAEEADEAEEVRETRSSKKKQMYKKQKKWKKRWKQKG